MSLLEWQHTVKDLLCHMDSQLDLLQARMGTGPSLFLSAFTHCYVAASASLRWSLNDSVLVLQPLEVCVGMLQLAPIKEDNGI